jgi:hypothetical protein
MRNFRFEVDIKSECLIVTTNDVAKFFAAGKLQLRSAREQRICAVSPYLIFIDPVLQQRISTTLKERTCHFHRLEMVKHTLLKQYVEVL